MTWPGSDGVPFGRNAPVRLPSLSRMFRPVSTISRHGGSRGSGGTPSGVRFSQYGSIASVQPWMFGSENPEFVGAPTA